MQMGRRRGHHRDSEVYFFLLELVFELKKDLSRFSHLNQMFRAGPFLAVQDAYFPIVYEHVHIHTC